MRNSRNLRQQVFGSYFANYPSASRNRSNTMYEGFYSLQRVPFSLTPDPEFLFMTESHRNAAAGLTYAILSKKGFCVLTGEAGTGKTTLLRSVMESIPPSRTHFSFLLNPALSTAEFFELALTDFGIETSHDSKAQRLSKLEHLLLDIHREGKIAVLFIDEAHRLSVELLEEVRLLTNFETDREKLLQIVLAGQDELGDMLDRYELRQLKQRVAIRLAIKPLSAAEVASYIVHRWKKVSDTEAPFTAEAIRVIADMSAGIPRVINAICDNALLLGYAEGAPWIGKEYIAEVGRDLHLVPGPSGLSGQPKAVTPPTPSSPLAQGLPSSPNGRKEKIRLRIPTPVSRSNQTNPIPTLERYATPQRWGLRWGPR